MFFFFNFGEMNNFCHYFTHLSRKHYFTRCSILYLFILIVTVSIIIINIIIIIIIIIINIMAHA